ncbi:MAG: hypothetical protein AB7O52_14370 [Planctomycetota bacterium]
MDRNQLLTRGLGAALYLLFATSSTPAQLLHFPEVILVDGGAVPGATALLDNVDRPNVSASGLLAGTADLDGTVNDEVLVVGGIVFAIEGMALPSIPAAAFASFDEFTTRHHVNVAGDVAFVAVLSGVPTTADTVLCRNLDVIGREGDPAPGIPGRTVSDFSQPCALDGGSLAYQATLTGDASNDQVIYIDQTVQLREGDVIVGTSFAGAHWESFTHLTANGGGDLLFEATTDAPDFNTDAGLFRKPFGSDPELLLRERTTPIIAASGMETIEFIDFVELAESGDWILRGDFVNSATVTSANDDCVVASIGGGPPTTLLQEGQAVPEIPGAVLGAITSASINSAGDVLVTAIIVSPAGVNIQEGLFLNGNLLLHDNIPIPSLPGAFLTSFEGDDVVLSDNGAMFFEGTLTGAPGNDGWFRVALPNVFPVENITCTATAQNELRASWTIPPGFSYDFIEISIDGNPLTSIAGGATDFVTLPQTMSVQSEIGVVGFLGSEASPQRSCRASLFLQTEDLFLIPESNTNSVGAYRAADGIFVGEFVHPGVILETPVDAELGPDQRVYVSDQSKNAVYRFDRNGNLIDRFIDSNDGVTSLRGLAFDGNELYVASGLPTPVHPPGIFAFDLSGNEVGVLLEETPTSGFEPFDVLFLPNHSALVTNVENASDIRWIPPGGGSYTSLLPASFPLQVAPLANGNFVVAASNANSLVEFNLSGNVVATWPVGAPVRGVAELANGQLLFTTTTTVSTLDRSTGQTQMVRFAVSPRMVGRLPAGTGTSFRRGDCNADGSVNITDAVRLLGVLFPPAGCIPDTDGIPDGPPECPIATCRDACDANDDGSVNITDAVFLLGVLFPPAGCIPDTDGIPDGPPECPIFSPPAPGCGPDPTPDNVDCVTYPSCP